MPPALAAAALERRQLITASGPYRPNHEIRNVGKIVSGRHVRTNADSERDYHRASPSIRHSQGRRTIACVSSRSWAIGWVRATSVNVSM
jgi:hypothetical protein